MRSFPAVLVALVLSASVATAQLRPTSTAQPLPTASPESKGFSPERLARIRAFVEDEIKANRYAGAIWLIARNGHIVDFQAVGQRDREAGLPMEKDTIVRIYSMSKVITSVAAMILVEEGRLRLDDEVGTYIPEFRTMNVWQGGTAECPRVKPAERPITIKQLLTHTSGLIYGFGDGPLDELYRKTDPYASNSMAEFVKKAAALPLAFEPGERYSYGFGIDVIGAVVEKIAGQPFEEFVRTRITEPLGMRDTGFDLPQDRFDRIARIYRRDKGTLVPAEPFATVEPAPGKGFAAGGAGMFSTASDYARFGQMLLNGGELDGVRILGRKTVELMMQNHLAHLDPPTTEPGGGLGFGIGGSVRVNVANQNEPGSIGQFGWAGAATTLFQIDPKEQTMMLLLTQHAPFNEGELFRRFMTLAYAALVD